MNLSPRAQWLALALAAVAGALLLFLFRLPTTQAQGAAAPAGPRYTVVFTEGTNLCVTDNQTNKLHFYTVDPEMKPGADLKLRGTVDLTQVGKPVIKPTLTTKKDR